MGRGCPFMSVHSYDTLYTWCADIPMAGSEVEFCERACRAFRECCQLPTAVGARIHASGGPRFEIEAFWSQRELERGKKVVFTKSYFVAVEGDKVEKLAAGAFQADATRVVKVSYASDSATKAVLLKDKPARSAQEDSPTDPLQYIEVWSEGSLLNTIDVKSLKKHAKINEDAHFGSFQLSSSGEWLLYVAEKEKPKATSYFKKVDQSEEGSQRGTEYVFEPDWGEQLKGVVCPVVGVVNVRTEECSVVDTSKMGDISAGQAQWVPGEEGGLVFVGWENTPRKLGFIYCFNRRGALYHADFKSGKWSRLTDTTHHVFSPRFNNQGDKLVYLEAVAGGPHNSCAALKMINWPTKTISTMVDIVNRSPQGGGFPGLYTVLLPARCWDAEGKKVLLHSWWGSTQDVVCVEVEGGGVHRVTEGQGEKGTWTVLDVAHGLVVAQFASPSTPPKLLVGTLPTAPGGTVSWAELAAISSPLTEGVTWEIMEFTPEEGDIPYEGILTMPKPDPSSSLPPLPPLIVAPHGGPHVVFTANFFPWPVCLTALGFAVLMVNYRGSGGFGQDSVFSLLGKIGTQEVRDVHNAAVAVLKRGVVDGERVGVTGGSHGGFICVHLIGQFPDFYKVASVRNPVVNVPAMAGVTDIPDWCYVESGLPYVPSKPPTAADLSQMLTVSPIVHAEKIKAPLLISLGSEDQRVPISQGKLLYHTLKAMGKPVRLLLYPGDAHPIDSVYSDADSFVNNVTWLHKHCSC